MKATTDEIALDLSDDFDAVLAMAIVNFGPPIVACLEPSDPPCHRLLASNRLFLRRWAARRQRRGESWSYADTLDLVDAELGRMGASAEEAKGCGSCHVCHPKTCEERGGIKAECP
jgi:hypothetical protein